MEKDNLLKTLAEKITGILYFSESEYPFTIEDFGHITPVELQDKIAAIHDAPRSAIKPVTADAFFDKIARTADPNDTVIVANAKRIKDLYSFLKDHFSNITVISIENGTSIPIYITGFLTDGSCIAVTTTSIET